MTKEHVIEILRKSRELYFFYPSKSWNEYYRNLRWYTIWLTYELERRIYKSSGNPIDQIKEIRNKLEEIMVESEHRITYSFGSYMVNALENILEILIDENGGKDGHKHY